MAVHEIGDMSVFTLDGASVLGVFEDIDYSVDATIVDGAAVTSPGETPQETKRFAKLTTKLMSTLSAPDRVSHLDLSAASLGGTAYLGTVRSLNLNGTYKQNKQAGVGAGWTKPQNSTKMYKATVDLDCNDDVASAFEVKMHSSTYSDRDMVLSFTLNGVPITIPMRMTRVQLTGQRGDLQSVKIELQGKCPDTGAYPTAPTTGTTLLSKAFLAWKTAITFAFTSKASKGVAVSGNAIFNSFTIDIQDEQIVSVQYAFDSYGTVAAVATA